MNKGIWSSSITFQQPAVDVKKKCKCNLLTHEAPKSLRAHFSVSVRSRSNWNLELLVFGERGKRSTRRKTSWSKAENQQQTQPTYRHRGLNPGHIGGRRALSPLRHPCSPKDKFILSKIFWVLKYFGQELDHKFAGFLELQNSCSFSNNNYSWLLVVYNKV